MITVLHGDDISQSRTAFNQLREENPGSQLFDGENLTLELLKQEVEGRLWGGEQAIFIENLLVSQQKELIVYLEAQNEQNVVIWEGKEINAGILAKFKNAKVQNFKLKKVLFTFLDNIRPKNAQNSISLFHQTLKTTEAELVFFMLVRHFRLMLATLSNSKIEELKKLQSWQMGKLKYQASLFGENKLKEFYNKLFEIEKNQKTGNAALSLVPTLDLFLLNI